jgi:cobalt-zinc-cadmium efflux system membrane fusion protein
MNKMLRAALAVLLATTFGLTFVMADEGHNHDHGPAAPAGEASPRFEAHSNLFELVGVVEKGQLTVYLDRFATNEPISGAKIEYESGSDKGVATPQPDGTYAIKLAGLDKPGERSFSFTVASGSDTDLLAGELHIGDAHAHEKAAPRPWLRWAGFAAASAAVAAAVFARRRPRAVRPEEQEP